MHFRMTENSGEAETRNIESMYQTEAPYKVLADSVQRMGWKLCSVVVLVSLDGFFGSHRIGTIGYQARTTEIIGISSYGRHFSSIASKEGSSLIIQTKQSNAFLRTIPPPNCSNDYRPFPRLAGYYISRLEQKKLGYFTQRGSYSSEEFGLHEG
jgi:hypothetical protein